MRIKSNWFKPGREHSPQDLAGALSFVTWRIADNALKNTRKADFEIVVGDQYFAFFNEFLFFLIQVADRIAYRRLSPDDRALFTGTLANRIAQTQAENQSRLLSGDEASHKQAFIDLLNLRSDGYSDFEYDENGPAFRFTRYLGFCMGDVMSEADSIWIVDQIMSIEAPEAVKMVEKTLRDLLKTEPRPARRRNSTSGD